MTAQPAIHRRSVLQALFVTRLWSASWLVIKWGQVDVPQLTFAALRYTLPALFLVAWLLLKRSPGRIRWSDRCAPA